MRFFRRKCNDPDPDLLTIRAELDHAHQLASQTHTEMKAEADESRRLYAKNHIGPGLRQAWSKGT